MKKYRIRYVHEQWYELDIEANSESEALDSFHLAHFTSEPRLVGEEIQDSVSVQEVGE